MREAILGREREPQALRTEVREMREKMRQQLGTAPAQEEQQFHLKQDRGGLVDIEFMVQYLVLAHAHQQPGLMTYTDNIRILDAIEQAGLLPPEQAESLREVYKAYRAFGHRQTLQNRPTIVSGGQLQAYRERISRCWHELMEL